MYLHIWLTIVYLAISPSAPGSDSETVAWRHFGLALDRLRRDLTSNGSPNQMHLGAIIATHPLHDEPC